MGKWLELLNKIDDTEARETINPEEARRYITHFAKESQRELRRKQIELGAVIKEIEYVLLDLSMTAGEGIKRLREFKSSRGGRGSSSHGGIRTSSNDDDFARAFDR